MHFKTIAISLALILSMFSACKSENSAFFVTSKDGLILRKKPTTDSLKIITIPYGALVKVIEKNGPAATLYGKKANWYKISFNKKTGWVFSGFLYNNQLPVYFGLIFDRNLWGKDNNIREGNPFGNFYKNGQFHKVQIEYNNKLEIYKRNMMQFLDVFERADMIYGFDKFNNKYDLKIKELVGPTGGLYEVYLLFNNSQKNLRNNDIFFTTGKDIINIVKPEPVRLSAGSLKKLKGTAKSLVKQHSETYSELYKGVVFKKEKVDLVKDKNKAFKLIYMPTIIKYSPYPYGQPEEKQDKKIYSDERGGVFFILSSDDKIIFKTFGHPEWSPNAENMMHVRQSLYFKLIGYPNLLSLVFLQGGYESYGFSIMDIEKGTILSDTL